MPTAAVERAAEAASQMLDDHPDILLDVALCHDSLGVIVKGRPSATFTELAQWLAREFPSVTVVSAPSRHSLNEMTAIRGSVRGLPELAKAKFALHVDANTEQVVVEIDPAAPGMSAATKTLSSMSEIRIARSAQFGTTSNVWGDRNSDFEPFQAGGIVYPSQCSLGPRVRLGGQEMILTAGHCGTSSQYKSGSGSNLVIGSLHTTAYPGNADIYGDWQLIKGRDYSDWVFTGAPYNDKTSLQGTGLNLNWRARGLFLCSSGMTTGQWCRARITYTDDEITLGGVLTGRQYATILDSGTSATGTCLYTGQNGKAPDGLDRGGDSGGAVYHSNGGTPTTVTYDGLVAGMSWQWMGASYSCKYYYTALVGVKAYAPTISW